MPEDGFSKEALGIALRFAPMATQCRDAIMDVFNRVTICDCVGHEGEPLIDDKCNMCKGRGIILTPVK